MVKLFTGETLSMYQMQEISWLLNVNIPEAVYAKLWSGTVHLHTNVVDLAKIIYSKGNVFYGLTEQKMIGLIKLGFCDNYCWFNDVTRQLLVGI